MMNPKLTLVSITGADDATDLEALLRLNDECVGVEWALLYGPDLEGRLRYPTAAWRERFFDAINDRVNSTAVHLCGPGAFAQLLSGKLPADVARAKRLQLNINARRQDFPMEVVLDIYGKALELGPDLILQFHEGTEESIRLFLAALDEASRRRVGVLLDASKGQGVAPDAWVIPEGLDGVQRGFAGGIGPENILKVLEQVSSMEYQPYWVDMESRVRTANLLDLMKVRAVLAASARLS